MVEHELLLSVVKRMTNIQSVHVNYTHRLAQILPVVKKTSRTVFCRTI
jgi:hypothetical protein